MTITRLSTVTEAIAVIETREPQGLFYVLDNDTHVAIDNTTGEAWTEEFTSQTEAQVWLTGKEDANLWQKQS